MSHAIVFVHLGESLPAYLADALFQVRLFNSCPVYLIAEQAALAAVPPDPALAIQTVPTETLPTLPSHAAFRQSAGLDRQFRFGFWTYVIERFFYLEALAERLGLENMVHLETDNLLYVDLDKLVPVLAKLYPGIAVPFDTDDRAVAGLIYFRNRKAVSALANAIASIFLGNPGIQINDMNLLGLLSQNFGPEVIDSLPVVPGDDPGPMRSLSNGPSTRPTFYYRHFDELLGIFDANPTGQYLDGVDPRNTGGRQTVGFINESAVFWPSRYRYMLIPDEQGRRIPHVCTKNGNRWPLFNFHVHSKNLSAFLSRPRPCKASVRLAGSVPRITRPEEIPESELITSERLQALADISLVDDASAASINNNPLLPEIQFCRLGGIHHRLIIDSVSEIRELLSANLIFVYPYLVESFFEHVLPHLPQRFVLITHGGDECITEVHRHLLNDVRVLHWFAQNAAIRHPKLTALPKGVANLHEAHGEAKTLAEAMRQQRVKTSDLYGNIDLRTNPVHRQPIFDALSKNALVTRRSDRPSRNYFEELAESRFAVSLCSDGFDTHRIWEAIYLDVIPIVPAGVWMEEFSDLPILPVAQWEQIDADFLAREETRIRSEQRPLDKLLLSYWRNRIHTAVTRRETGSF
jgi:hypothetical protein